ncbi:hypothetical protein CWR48_13475 [Oceanobacillus arenosus]|uniref:Creatinase N-terminal domain-containing protein n=1 Tax=Oceanobacillus arenosus TaxID=1229153 RepID=A0A3D8PQH8_9BACI|nr:hypothetical protein CWR48_13475 [Oceanobacillus arenosus]
MKRIQKLQTYLKNKKIDTAMITDPANVFYLTEFLSAPHIRFHGIGD